MNILYIAFACNPFAGSEAQCGWSWPITMQKYANVSVVTRKENKRDIERYMAEHYMDDVNIYYYDIPEAINPYNKTGKLYMIYYLMWQATSFGFIKKLHDKFHYDYIHHVTLGDFRSISPAWRLDSKFIFGPVGGAQLTPKSLRPYTKSNQKQENRRERINKLVRFKPGYIKALNKAYLVLAANGETQSALQKYLVDSSKCKLVTENGVRQDQIRKVEKKYDKDEVVLLWSGRMINRKGLGFLLDTLQFVDTKTKYKLMLVGDGPEKTQLIKQVNINNLTEKVEFIGKVSYEEMQEIYQKSDVFVFPSLRETTGTVLFEAMVNALPVVTFNQNGAALLINDNCGIKVDITNDLDAVKHAFAMALCRIIDDSELRIDMGHCAQLHIVENYTWEKKCIRFRDDYLL